MRILKVTGPAVHRSILHSRAVLHSRARSQSPYNVKAFSRRLIDWQKVHGRHGLPWQGTRDPYRLWLSEIMLQQTQVATVIPYYERFLARFPDVAALAGADPGEVMRLWSGLGYYARARNLHGAARRVVETHGGRFPLQVDAVADLPGIGRSTAAAIVAFATGEPHAILDGNVKRVLARHAGIAGPVDSSAVIARLWETAQSRLPRRDVEAYTQGLMDLGSTLCSRTSPDCGRCPVRADCVARREGRTDELPGPKAARAAKLRRAVWLVVIAGGRVLLEQRPAPGIWGGLWSFPAFAEGMDPREACASLGVAPVSIDPLPNLRHAFTHFTLEATPFRVRVRRTSLAAGEPGRRWIGMVDAQDAALPAPVKRLLATLAPEASRSGAARAGTGAGSRAAPRRR
ncbi:MAG: A/G-specific adenine glycosylase [Betaproteobacteria bacterium]|nr:A/G-specific adenine glycosylase [Betaproteobacteria bacterium]